MEKDLAVTMIKHGGTTDWQCDHCQKVFSIFELKAKGFTCECGSTDIGKLVCEKEKTESDGVTL